MEGWDVVISDRWNSEQQILPEEIDNNQDLDNHVFEIRPYKWATGWSDGILMQVVDVVPNESYTLSALLKGGIAKKEGKLTGKMIIEEVQDPEKKSSQKLPVTTGKLIQWTILLLPNVTKFAYPLQ